MNVRVLDEATDDLADGWLFYENQSAGLGDYFLDTLWSDILSLSIFAGIHEIHSGRYRLLSKRFPYAVYYKIEHQTAIVQAVLDCRSNPEQVTARFE